MSFELFLTFLGGIIGGGGVIKAYEIFVSNKTEVTENQRDAETAFREELRENLRLKDEQFKILQEEFMELKKDYANLIIKSAHLESRANLYEEQSKQFKLASEKNENEVKRLNEVINELRLKVETTNG